MMYNQEISTLCGSQSAWNVGDLVSIPGLGRSPEEGKGYPLQGSGLENSIYSPWGRKKSDTTERPSLSLFIIILLSQMTWGIPGYTQ